MRNVAAFVVTAHGYGHASRQMEVIRVLLGRRPDLDAVVFAAAPDAVFRDYLGHDPALSARVRVIGYRADVGVVQRDGLTMDHDATLAALSEKLGDFHDFGPGGRADRAVAELASRLAGERPSVVIGDAPPVAFAAAHRIGVPSVAVANFDWGFIYEHYAASRSGFADAARLCRAWQGLATIAVHLPPGPPLSGFPSVVPGAPLARTLLVDPHAIRERLSIPRDDRAVLVSFGGFGLTDSARRIPRIPGVTWILAPPMDPLAGRDDARFVTDEPYLGLLAACDAVFTKPGYGIVCEAARNRTRLLYTDRGDFPEYPWLVGWLSENAPSVHVPSSELGTSRGSVAVRDGLDALFALPDRFPDRWDGADRVTDTIEALL